MPPRTDPITFSITPFYNTRQFYYGLAQGEIDPPPFAVDIEYNHSPVKDQKLLCGSLDATTMSMGKYVMAKSVSHTDVVPTDPLAIAAGLTYQEGNGLFVAGDSTIFEPLDLEGCRVGIHDSTLAMTYHKAVLEERFDVRLDRIEWIVDTHQQLGNRIAAGDLDAVERINDWYWEYRDGGKYRMLYDIGTEWEELHGYYPLVHLISIDRCWYDEDPAGVSSFIDALRRSSSYREEHYEEILEAFIRSADGEWTGDRSMGTLRKLTGGVRCPFRLGKHERQNVLEWMGYAHRYDVFESMPLDADRLFPEWQ